MTLYIHDYLIIEFVAGWTARCKSQARMRWDDTFGMPIAKEFIYAHLKTLRLAMLDRTLFVAVRGYFFKHPTLR